MRKVYQCSNCLQEGHNSSTCKNAKVEPPAYACKVCGQGGHNRLTCPVTHPERKKRKRSSYDWSTMDAEMSQYRSEIAPEGYWSVERAAEWCKRDKHSIYRWIRSKKIRWTRAGFGRRIYINVASLHALGKPAQSETEEKAS